MPGCLAADLPTRRASAVLCFGLHPRAGGRSALACGAADEHGRRPSLLGRVGHHGGDGPLARSAGQHPGLLPRLYHLRERPAWGPARAAPPSPPAVPTRTATAELVVPRSMPTASCGGRGGAEAAEPRCLALQATPGRAHGGRAWCIAPQRLGATLLVVLSAGAQCSQSGRSLGSRAAKMNGSQDDLDRQA